jgi:hypothetical protein
MRQAFSENFGFTCQSTFHLLLHNHLHYHPRLAQSAGSGRSANSLTAQLIIIIIIIIIIIECLKRILLSLNDEDHTKHCRDCINVVTEVIVGLAWIMK